MAQNIPAPWHLEGSGYIMSYRFPKQFILKHGFLEKRYQEGFYGKVGYVVFADYRDSNIGPYQELLFIPGKVRYQRRKAYTIAKIFVSTPEAAANGRQNWGIPKELADFSVTREGADRETIKVTKDGEPVLNVTVSSGSGLSFPVHTLLMPFPLVHHRDGQNFWVKPHGHGTAKFAQNLDVDINAKFFPNFVFSRHVAVMRVADFKLNLPAAKVGKE